MTTTHTYIYIYIWCVCIDLCLMTAALYIYIYMVCVYRLVSEDCCIIYDSCGALFVLAAWFFAAGVTRAMSSSEV